VKVNRVVSKRPCESCEKLIAEVEFLKVQLESSKNKLLSLEKTSEQLSILLKNTPDFIYIKDSEHRFTSASDAFARLTSHSSWQELVGKNDFDIFPKEHAEVYFEFEKDVIAQGEALVLHDEPYYAEGGELRWVTSTKVPVKDDGGNIVGLVGISKDITELKCAQSHIREMANLDHLSGLLNRRAFNEQVTPLYDRCVEAGDYAFVLFIDLDNFKSINDAYGHDVGDQVIGEFADLLRSVVRSNEYVARVGGDEFLVYLDRESNPSAGELLAKRIVTKFSESDLGRYPVLGCSIGVSGTRDASLTLSELISSADKSMYLAKEMPSPSYFPQDNLGY